MDRLFCRGTDGWFWRVSSSVTRTSCWPSPTSKPPTLTRIWHSRWWKVSLEKERQSNEAWNSPYVALKFWTFVLCWDLKRVVWKLQWCQLATWSATLSKAGQRTFPRQEWAVWGGWQACHHHGKGWELSMGRIQEISFLEISLQAACVKGFLDFQSLRKYLSLQVWCVGDWWRDYGFLDGSLAGKENKRTTEGESEMIGNTHKWWKLSKTIFQDEHWTAKSSGVCGGTRPLIQHICHNTVGWGTQVVPLSCVFSFEVK